MHHDAGRKIIENNILESGDRYFQILDTITKIFQ